MAEWLNALVLKTSGPKGSVGSNPTTSANNNVIVVKWDTQLIKSVGKQGPMGSIPSYDTKKVAHLNGSMEKLGRLSTLKMCRLEHRGSNPLRPTKFYREDYMQTQKEIDRIESDWEARWEDEYQEYLESLDEEDEEDDDDYDEADEE